MNDCNVALGMSSSSPRWGLRRRHIVKAATGVALALGLTRAASAGPLLDRLREQRQAAGHSGPSGRHARLANVAYGSHPDQVYDVYLPSGEASTHGAPVVFIVHGGGWVVGDKAMTRVVDAKVSRWTARGLVLVSVNYRMLPEVPPDGQLRDVAQALTHAQAHALDWGADPAQFILMGHSAGAHLVALLAGAVPASLGLSGPPVLGTVALDSAAMDVHAIMSQPHMRLYDRPFGKDPSYWRAMSPVQQLRPGAAPLLAVCSTRRDDACAQAQAFVARAAQLGIRAQWLGQDLSHGDINALLGLDNEYTRAVEAFMVTLSSGVAQRLGR